MMLVPLLLGIQVPQFDPLPLDRGLIGEWVTVATNGADYKGYLWLNADGRFTQKFVQGKSKKAKLLSGTFQYGKMNRQSLKERMSQFGEGVGEPPDWKMVRLSLSFDAAQKWGFPASEVKRRRQAGDKNVVFQQLIFEPSGPVLHDLLTVAYARKGQEAKIKKLMEQSRKP